jgi:hypothetical protein
VRVVCADSVASLCRLHRTCARGVSRRAIIVEPCISLHSAAQQPTIARSARIAGVSRNLPSRDATIQRNARDRRRRPATRVPVRRATRSRRRRSQDGRAVVCEGVAPPPPSRRLSRRAARGAALGGDRGAARRRAGRGAEPPLGGRRMGAAGSAGRPGRGHRPAAWPAFTAGDRRPHHEQPSSERSSHPARPPCHRPGADAARSATAAARQGDRAGARSWPDYRSR